MIVELVYRAYAKKQDEITRGFITQEQIEWVTDQPKSQSGIVQGIATQCRKMSQNVAKCREMSQNVIATVCYYVSGKETEKPSYNSLYLF